MKWRIDRWLADMSKYPQVLRRVVGMAGKGGVTDYSEPEYSAVRERTISRLHPRRMSLEVVDLIDETPTVRTLRMRRNDGPMPIFRAGQYVNLFVEINGVRTSRPYSISSAPGAHYIDLTVREMAGGFVSPYLANDVPTSMVLESTGPAGHFRYEPLIDGDDLVFIAGGSGVTPFLSMLRDFANHHWPVRVRLIYGSRNREEITFAQELERLAHGNDCLQVDHVLSEPDGSWRGATGLLDQTLLKSLLGSLDGRRYYICGPNAMCNLVIDSLGALGVPNHLLRRELYGPPAQITEESVWPSNLPADTRCQVAVEGRGEFDVAANETLLNSLERNGVEVRATCRSGECGACRLQLLSGRVVVSEQTCVREADTVHGFVHACASYPIEDVKVKIP